MLQTWRQKPCLVSPPEKKAVSNLMRSSAPNTAILTEERRVVEDVKSRWMEENALNKAL